VNESHGKAVFIYQEDNVNIISLGAGVQSTTVALMAAERLITPMPDAAIFADTGWEPKAVYEHLDRLRKALPFPVHVVSHGNIRQDTLAKTNSSGQRFSSIPWFIDSPRGGIGRRQCTKEYKLVPIYRAARALIGKAPRERILSGAVNMWIGISTDEAIRMKPARVKWVTNRFPLIDAGMSRVKCLDWLKSRGWSAPKSSCLGCPFHSNAMWRELKKNPDEWADIVEVDRAIRVSPKTKYRQYMHPSLQPIDEVDFRSLEDRGQLNMFGNECEGMCGV
jgi:hypothetical protein